MVRALRWVALIAFLSLPVIVYLGRPVQQGCPNAGRSICDPYRVSPTWLGPALLVTFAVAILLLLLAAVASRKPEEDRP